MNTPPSTKKKSLFAEATERATPEEIRATANLAARRKMSRRDRIIWDALALAEVDEGARKQLLEGLAPRTGTKNSDH